MVDDLFQQGKVARLQIAEEALRGLAAGQVVLAPHAQHARFQIGQTTGLQAQFPHPPRGIQKVELVERAPVVAQAAERVARFQQRHVERPAVEGHGGVEAL